MSALNWPKGVDRTPKDERVEKSNFQVNFQRTQSELREEMEKMGVEKWWLDHVTGSAGDPGVVLRWEDPDTTEQRAVWCDGYVYKKDNLREVYLWVNETRMREKRLAETAGDAFASAALPPGDPEAAQNGHDDGNDWDYDLDVTPHAMLGVPEDADEEAIRDAARDAIVTHHPDQSEDEDAHEYVQRVKAARDALLD